MMFHAKTKIVRETSTFNFNSLSFSVIFKIPSTFISVISFGYPLHCASIVLIQEEHTLNNKVVTLGESWRCQIKLYMGQNYQDVKYALSVSLFVSFHGDLESKISPK